MALGAFIQNVQQRFMHARSHEMLWFVFIQIDFKQCHGATNLNHTPWVGQQPRALTAARFCTFTTSFGSFLGKNQHQNHTSLGPEPYFIPVILVNLMQGPRIRKSQ